MNPKSGAIGDADARGSVTGVPSGWRSARDVFAIDEVDQVVALSQTAAGRLAIYLIGLTAVMPTNGWKGSLLVVTAAMASALVPAWRNRILLAATWAVAFFELVFDRNAIRSDIAVFLRQENLGHLSALALAFGAYLIFIACVWIGLQAVRRNRTSFGARHPVLTLLGIEAALLCMASLDLHRGPWRAVL
ncbi:MAG: hypothetical protein ACTHKB_08950, partial [Burkholderiaceae bacterium]